MTSLITNEIGNFIRELSPRLAVDLSAWYGTDAKLIEPPVFQERDWSYFFRYRVQISETQAQPILVKLRHLENMSVQEAVNNSKMREEAKEEYASLIKLRDVFSSQTNMFFTIRPLVFYEDLSAIVMEEAKIQTLKSYFESPRMWIGSKAQETFAAHMKLTGFWLRIFHDQCGERWKDSFFKESYYLAAKGNLKKIDRIAGKHGLSFARTLLDNLYEKYKHNTLPYRTTHDNFSVANVFVTGDGKICSFDPHSKPGPIYLDLAKLITDMETSKVQVLTDGMSVPYSLLDKFTKSFLSGYFKTETIDYTALNLFCLMLIIEKWAESEEKFMKETRKIKHLYTLITPQMRHYYKKRLQRRIAMLT